MILIEDFVAPFAGQCKVSLKWIKFESWQWSYLVHFQCFHWLRWTLLCHHDVVKLFHENFFHFPSLFGYSEFLCLLRIVELSQEQHNHDRRRRNAINVNCENVKTNIISILFSSHHYDIPPNLRIVSKSRRKEVESTFAVLYGI